MQSDKEVEDAALSHAQPRQTQTRFRAGPSRHRRRLACRASSRAHCDQSSLFSLHIPYPKEVPSFCQIESLVDIAACKFSIRVGEVDTPAKRGPATNVDEPTVGDRKTTQRLTTTHKAPNRLFGPKMHHPWYRPPSRRSMRDACSQPGRSGHC